MSDGSRQGAGLALVGALLLMSVHVAGRAARDSLFLANLPIELLPRLMIAAALSSLAGSLLMGRLLRQTPPSVLVPIALLMSAALFVAEWAFVLRSPGAGAVVLYLHMGALAGIAVSGFWSVVNERFDPYTAKAVVARAGGFGALGGVAGGLGALLIAPRLGVQSLLLGFAALHGLAALLVFALGRGTSAVAAGDAVQRPGLRLALRSPLILRMGALVAIVAGTEELIDYAFKAAASETFDDEASLVRFFAAFYTATNVGAFALQTGLGRRALESLGLGGTMALLPAGVAFGAAGAAFFAKLTTISAVRALNAVFHLSFFRAGFELLWTPIAPGIKRPTKPFVDVGARSLGEITAAGLILGLLALWPTLPESVWLASAASLCIVALLLIAGLNRGYVRQLADNLRKGTVQIEPDQILDATTARTLSGGQVTIDRAELEARIHEAERAEADGEDGPMTREAAAADLDLERLRGLLAADPERVERALIEGPADPRLVSAVTLLLARSDVAGAAGEFLREVAARTTGQLADTLLDPQQPLLLRRRVPRALEAGDPERALQALCSGLADPDFEVRLACARAAAQIVGLREGLRRERRTVLAWVERELTVDDRTWEQQGRRRLQSAERSALLGPALLPRVDRSVELVFTIFALSAGTEVMASTLRALYSGDAALRGTALEYIQVSLPEGSRAVLWQRLPGATEARRPSRRAAKALEEELVGHPLGRRGGR